MEKLEYRNLKDELQVKNYDVPQTVIGETIKVVDKNETVSISIDGKEIMLGIQGARDLALALRISANRVEKRLHN